MEGHVQLKKRPSPRNCRDEGGGDDDVSTKKAEGGRKEALRGKKFEAQQRGDSLKWEISPDERGGYLKSGLRNNKFA